MIGLGSRVITEPLKLWFKNKLYSTTLVLEIGFQSRVFRMLFYLISRNFIDEGNFKDLIMLKATLSIKEPLLFSNVGVHFVSTFIPYLVGIWSIQQIPSKTDCVLTTGIYYRVSKSHFWKIACHLTTISYSLQFRSQGGRGITASRNCHWGLIPSLHCRLSKTPDHWR